MSDPLDQPPPWQVFPDMTPWQVAARQGVQEAWVDGVWRPYWTGLTPAQREAYFVRWQAGQEWQRAIRAIFEAEPDFDAEADWAESQRFLAQRAPMVESGSPSDWRQRLLRLFRRR